MKFKATKFDSKFIYRFLQSKIDGGTLATLLKTFKHDVREFNKGMRKDYKLIGKNLKEFKDGLEILQNHEADFGKRRKLQ